MKTISYTEALREALDEELRRDSDVFLMGEDIAAYGGAFGVTRGLLDAHGAQRVINTPISEPGFVGAAVGAALVGSRPVVEIMFMDFLTLAMDQLVNQAAKLHYVFGPRAACPLVLRTAAGAGRSYGPTHSQMFDAWLINTPGLKVVAPATPADAKGLLKSAIRDNNPVVFIEHKLLYGTRGPVPDGEHTIPLGQARVVGDGEDVTIVAWSAMARAAEEAVNELARAGLHAQLIDLRTLAPMDTAAMLTSARRTGRVLIVDEGPRTGGVSAEIGFRIFEGAHDYLDAPIRRLTAPDNPIPASPALEQAMLPNPARIADAAIALIEEA
jgi:pyruvate/2-oxoglutarate/acetoin dehydrogenase E1 component